MTDFPQKQVDLRVDTYSPNVNTMSSLSRDALFCVFRPYTPRRYVSMETVAVLGDGLPPEKPIAPEAVDQRRQDLLVSKFCNASQIRSHDFHDECMNTIRVVIADNPRIFRQGVRALLHAQTGFS